MLYTIGYQGLSLQQLQEVMNTEDIDKLLDIRSIPQSRWKADFNKATLMATFGKAYCWKGRLLGGKHGPVPPAGIGYLLKLPVEKKYLLMCMEADPLKCHRYLDLGLRLLERGLNITHIVQTMNGWQLWTTSELKGETLWT